MKNTTIVPRLRGLEETALVRTPVFDEITAALQYTATHRGTMMVAGRHGAGKRTALLSCLAEQSVPATVWDAPPKLSAKETTRDLYDAVHPEKDNFDLRDMQDELAATLASGERMIVVDHAELLTTEAAAQLHYLHNRPGANWSLVLLGGPPMVNTVKISAGLRGELLAAVEVKKFATSTDAAAHVRQLHPMFKFAEDNLLIKIDQDLCHGMWKSWARFLQAALYLSERQATGGPASDRGDDVPPLETPAVTLDLKLARAAIATLPKSMNRS